MEGRNSELQLLEQLFRIQGEANFGFEYYSWKKIIIKDLSVNYYCLPTLPTMTNRILLLDEATSALDAQSEKVHNNIL